MRAHRAATVGRSLAFAALIATIGAGCTCSFGPRVLLVVDLQTDVAPILEFETIRVRANDELAMRAVEPGESFLEGRRAAELRVGTGTVRVSVELLDRRGIVRAERSMLVQVRTDTAILVPISGLCRGVSCPDPDQTCYRGSCVDVTSICDGQPCDPDSCPGGLCDPQECDVDDDCDRIDPCSTPTCSGSVCVGVVEPGACEASYYCSVGLGCRSIPPEAMFDAGVPRDGAIDGSGGGCGPCTATCGSAGQLECDAMGMSTGTCVPPEESCNGGDDDCDSRIDEGLGCDHEHVVIFELEDSDAGVADSVQGGGPGAVCIRSACGPTLTRFVTLPGPDGHRHDVSFNGSRSLTFGPTGTSFRATGTSVSMAHEHMVECTIFDDAGVVSPPPGTEFRHNLDDPSETDRYDHMCVPPLTDGECRRSFGNCVAR